MTEEQELLEPLPGSPTVTMWAETGSQGVVRGEVEGQGEASTGIEVRVVKDYPQKWLVTKHSGRRRLKRFTQLYLRREQAVLDLIESGVLKIV